MGCGLVELRHAEVFIIFKTIETSRLRPKSCHNQTIATAKNHHDHDHNHDHDHDNDNDNDNDERARLSARALPGSPSNIYDAVPGAMAHLLRDSLFVEKGELL